jgi:FkbM family methyltransferase
MLKNLLGFIYSKITNISFIHPLLYRRSLYIGQGAQDFWVFGEAFNQTLGGYFLDIGAYDGVTHSNTFLLESRYGWQGLCIEANPSSFKRLVANRKCTCIQACLDQESGKSISFNLDDMSSTIIADGSEASGENHISLKTQSLQDLLQQYKAPRIIDYCSVDIEGAEDRLFNGIDLDHYTFRTMTIERPSPAIREKLFDKGYILVREIPRLDVFFVHESFIDQYRANLLAFNYKKFLAIRWR